MELTMLNLENYFLKAKKHKWDYIGIKIQMDGFPEPEIIINPLANYDAKLEYYKKAYNDDLTLKAFSGIKIIDFSYGSSYEDIEEGYYSFISSDI